MTKIILCAKVENHVFDPKKTEFLFVPCDFTSNVDGIFLTEPTVYFYCKTTVANINLRLLSSAVGRILTCLKKQSVQTLYLYLL